MCKKPKFVGTIKGTPLIKFQEEWIIDLVQQGTFRMNSLKKYRDMYAKSGDEIIGDPHEGRLYVHSGTCAIPEMGVCEELKDVAIPTVSENDFVFCMFGVNPMMQKPFSFNAEQKSKLLGTYDTALVITDADEFMRRIHLKAGANGIEVIGGFVKYYDESTDEVGRLCSLLKDGIESIAFHKRSKYSYQQEYRFAKKNRDASKPYYEMDIGCICDISIKLPAADVFNSLIVPQST